MPSYAGSRTCAALALLLVVSFSPPLAAGERALHLGAIGFPTSGTPEAQGHFLRGVAAMHSFWYEEALAAFRESTRIQPDFLMGYWGEAMAHNHPVWQEQDLEAARAALARMPFSARATDRERAYVQAVRILFGKGTKEERDRAYAAAMEDLHYRYPEDLEAAAFYALALLGVAEHGPRASPTHIRAAAVALEVSRRKPDHPGAAHYTIHAFDDPAHAILALPAARRYAELAPAAHHALHMPAHIFLQLGMWAEAAAANEAGWQASVEWVRRERLPLGLRDYHSLYWLEYVYLQQGRFTEARGLLEQKRADMAAAGSDAEAMATGYERKVSRNYDEMLAQYVVETERWGAASRLLPGPGRGEDQPSALALFARGYAAAMLKDPEAERSLTTLRARRSDEDDSGTIGRIRERTLAAVIAASRGDLEQALAHMREAASLEERLSPPSGPPGTVKPPHELLGELLLSAGRPEEARTNFERALFRHPGRARALLGAARAAAQMGNDRDARDFYRQLLEVWKRADPDLPALEEARRSP